MEYKSDHREHLTRSSAKVKLEQLLQIRIMQFTVFTVGILLCLLLLVVALFAKDDFALISRAWGFVIVFGMLSAFCVVQSIELRSIILDKKALNNDAFSIEICTLQSLEYDRYNEIYTFSNGKVFKNPYRKGPHMRTSIDRLSKYTSCGDTFYLLTYDRKEFTVEYIYIDKFFSLKL